MFAHADAARRSRAPRRGRPRRRCCRCPPRSARAAAGSGLLEGDVLDHVAAALPGRHARRGLGFGRRARRCRWARRPCGRRRRRSRSRAPARRRACARRPARRRPAPRAPRRCAIATISLRRRDGAERVRDLRERDELRARAEQLLVLLEEDLAAVVDRHDAQAGARLRAELLPRHDVGVVLEPGDDDLVALADVAAGPSSGRRG